MRQRNLKQERKKGRWYSLLSLGRHHLQKKKKKIYSRRHRTRE